MRTKHILACQEYGNLTSFDGIAAAENTSANDLNRLLKVKASHIKVQINTKNAIQFIDNKFQFQKVAGLISLTPHLEIEICPKFLNPNDSDWKNDFFQIAAITSFGKIYPESELSGGNNTDTIFSDLLARVIINEFNKNINRPIRIYRRRILNSFGIEGDVDWDSAFLPNEDGFTQNIISYTRENEFNAVIFKAVLVLLEITRNPELKQHLNRILNFLTIQKTIRYKTRNPIPSRYKHWSDIFLLSLKLIEDEGISFEKEYHQFMPGFLIRTDLAWEELLRKACYFAFPGRVKKTPFPWGLKRGKTSSDEINVIPDIALLDILGNVKIIIDAKYKGRIDEKLKIQRNDLYEIFAYLNATSSKIGVLLYPTYSIASKNIGQVTEFERCYIDDLTIIGAIVSLSGISKSNGFRDLSLGITTFINTI